MNLRNLQVLWLGVFLILGHSPSCMGQSYSSAAGTSTIPTLATPQTCTPQCSPVAVSDQAGADATADIPQDSLSVVNSQVRQSTDEITGANALVERGPSPAAPGAASFGEAGAFGAQSINAGHSVFGVSSSSFQNGMSPLKGSGSSKQHAAESRLAGSASARLSGEQQGVTGTSTGATGTKAASAINAAVKHATPTAAESADFTGENTTASAEGGVTDADGAEYSNSFPDSTRNTAVLSPPESDESPFTAPGGMSFEFRDLADTGFLQPRLKAAAGKGEGQGSEQSLYERFLNRLQAERTASPSNGLRPTSKPSSGFSTLGQRSLGDMGLKPTSSLGLPSSMPF
jgi:hypothetical protein